VYSIIDLMFAETESWHIFYRHTPPAWYNSFPAARHAHSGIMHGGSLYVYGGMSDLEEKGDFWKFELGKDCMFLRILIILNKMNSQERRVGLR